MGAARQLSEEELERFYDKCDFDAPRVRHKRLAVIIPFIAKQVSMLKRSIATQWRRHRPCEPNAPRTDVVFFFHTSFEDEMGQLIAQELAALIENHEHSACFGQVVFLSAHLSPKNDVYGVGTVAMFYGLFEFAWLAQHYETFFLMEPDVVVIRSDWLGALQRESSGSEFWIRGSLVRTPNFLDNGWGADYSINGNALYRLGSACFNGLLARARHAAARGKAFDMALQALFRNAQYFAEQQHYLHRIQYADFIRNMGDGHTVTNVTALALKAPKTYFIHSKMWTI